MARVAVTASVPKEKRPMGYLALLVRRHALAAYVVLTFVLTWLAFIPYALAEGDGVPFFTFGPFAAAIVVTALTGGWTEVRTLFARLVRWRVAPIWYVIAIGLPVAIQLAAVGGNVAAGAAPPDWGRIPPLAEVAPMVVLFLIFSGPLGEEPGWRGFALPRLLAGRSTLAASLILGVIWAAWHLPLATVGDLSLAGTLNVVFAAVVFTWLFQRTAGSVLLAVLFHAAHQNSVRYLAAVAAGADRAQQDWIAVAIWGVLAVVIVLADRRAALSRHAASDGGQDHGDAGWLASRPASAA
jgi:membrane protease YdiL (CAAX protease family)